MVFWLQVSLSLDVSTFGLIYGYAAATLVQTAGSQGATAMLNNNLAGWHYNSMDTHD